MISRKHLELVWMWSQLSQLCPSHCGSGRVPAVHCSHLPLHFVPWGSDRSKRSRVERVERGRLETAGTRAAHHSACHSTTSRKPSRKPSQHGHPSPSSPSHRAHAPLPSVTFGQLRTCRKSMASAVWSFASAPALWSVFVDAQKLQSTSWSTPLRTVSKVDQDQHDKIHQVLASWQDLHWLTLAQRDAMQSCCPWLRPLPVDDFDWLQRIAIPKWFPLLTLTFLVLDIFALLDCPHQKWYPMDLLWSLAQ